MALAGRYSFIVRYCRRFFIFAQGESSCELYFSVLHLIPARMCNVSASDRRTKGLCQQQPQVSTQHVHGRSSVSSLQTASTLHHSSYDIATCSPITSAPAVKCQAWEWLRSYLRVAINMRDDSNNISIALHLFILLVSRLHTICDMFEHL